MLFITDRGSREELKSGELVSFGGVFDIKKIKECFRDSDMKRKKYFISDEYEEYSNIYFGPINKNLYKEVFQKQIETLLCNIFTVKKIVPFLCAKLEKSKEPSSYNEKDQIKKNINFDSLFSIQELIGLFAINMGEKSVWIKGKEIEPGSITFFKKTNLVPFESSIASSSFQKMYFFFMYSPKSMVVQNKDCLFNNKQTLHLCGVKDLEEKKILQDYDVNIIKDIGLSNV